MLNVLKTFLELLEDDKTVSSYELQTSGVVRALLHCLSQVRYRIASSTGLRKFSLNLCALCLAFASSRR